MCKQNSFTPWCINFYCSQILKKKNCSMFQKTIRKKRLLLGFFLWILSVKIFVTQYFQFQILSIVTLSWPVSTFPELLPNSRRVGPQGVQGRAEGLSTAAPRGNTSWGFCCRPATLSTANAKVFFLLYLVLTTKDVCGRVTGRFAHGQFALGQFTHGQFAQRTIRPRTIRPRTIRP